MVMTYLVFPHQYTMEEPCQLSKYLTQSLLLPQASLGSLQQFTDCHPFIGSCYLAAALLLTVDLLSS